MPLDSHADAALEAKRRRMRFSRSRFGCDACRHHKKKVSSRAPPPNAHAPPPSSANLTPRRLACTANGSATSPAPCAGAAMPSARYVRTATRRLGARPTPTHPCNPRCRAHQSPVSQTSRSCRQPACRPQGRPQDRPRTRALRWPCTSSTSFSFSPPCSPKRLVPPGVLILVRRRRAAMDAA